MKNVPQVEKTPQPDPEAPEAEKIHQHPRASINEEIKDMKKRMRIKIRLTDDKLSRKTIEGSASELDKCSELILRKSLMKLELLREEKAKNLAERDLLDRIIMAFSEAIQREPWKQVTKKVVMLEPFLPNEIKLTKERIVKTLQDSDKGSDFYDITLLSVAKKQCLGLKSKRPQIDTGGEWNKIEMQQRKDFGLDQRIADCLAEIESREKKMRAWFTGTTKK